MKTGSLINLIMDGAKVATVPEVGMGATALHWTDRDPYTIIKVSKSGRRFTMQRDKATALHTGMTDSQQWEYERDPSGSVSVVSLRKNGKWIVMGESIQGGLQVIVGRREKYYDYSF